MFNYKSLFVLQNLSKEILTDNHRFKMHDLITDSLYYKGGGDLTNDKLDISVTFHSTSVQVVIIYGTDEKSAEGFTSKSLSQEEESMVSFVELLGVTPDLNRHLNF
jgi:hypothetical protein